MALTLFPVTALAAEERLDIKDTVLNSPDASLPAMKVYPVAGDSEFPQPIQYTIPNSGAAVLIFFQTTCGNSQALFRNMSSSTWLRDDRVSVTAVEVSGANQASVQSFLSVLGENAKFVDAYYNADIPSQLWSAYLDLVPTLPNQAFAQVYVITKGADGAYIQYAKGAVNNPQTIASWLNDVLSGSGDTPDTPDTPDIPDIPDTPGNAVDVAVAGAYRYDYVSDVFASVNSNRAGNSRSPLTLSGKLTEMAMQRAAECALYYSHTRPDGRSCFTVIDGTYPHTMTAENIAAGYPGPSEVMNGWMNSEGHRANILNGSLTQIGVGCYESNGVLYWVQLFGNGSDATQPASSGRVPADVTVSALTSHLNTSLQNSQPLSVDVGETVTAPLLYCVNEGFPQGRTVLRPVVADVKDSGTAQTIASAANGGPGTGAVLLTGAAGGSGSVALCAYQGDTAPKRVELTVKSSAPDVPDVPDVPTPVVYTVTFSGYQTMTTGTDGRLSSLPVPTRAGYLFNGWYTDSGIRVTTRTVFTADTTVYAQWTLIDTTPSTPDSSGDSDPSYTISVPSRVTGGTVKLIPTSAAENQRVTITARPSFGYVLEKLTVTDSKGGELSLTDIGNYKYIFRMPKGNVSIHAEFQPDVPAEPVTPPTPAVPAGPVSAVPSSDRLSVDGKTQSPTAFAIEEYNYFKLRDLAALLNGTGKQFSVDYDGNRKAVLLTSGQPYTMTGTELAGPAQGGSRTAVVSRDTIYINGEAVQLPVYGIDGNNYFRLRDLGKALNFYVGWTREDGIMIESDKPYLE